jgi:peptidoglycan-associated lipoprotein
MRTRRSTIGIFALATLMMATTGCRKKAPVTAPTAEPAPAAVVSTEPAADPGTAAPYDPFAADLAALNEHIQREGLLGTVLFDYDSAELSQAARERLTSNARFLRERPELVVAIEGHADERGTNEYNLALGERRAGAAQQLLVTLGISPDRLRTISYGEERPKCSIPAESCWSTNRRAEFVVVGRTGVG